jgi:hypothetical protein
MMLSPDALAVTVVYAARSDATKQPMTPAAGIAGYRLGL